MNFRNIIDANFYFVWAPIVNSVRCDVLLEVQIVNGVRLPVWQIMDIAVRDKLKEFIETSNILT